MKMANTFLLHIALTKSAYLLLASLASKNRALYSEGLVYKREPELAASPQPNATFNSQHLCKETELATATQALLALFILTSNEHILDKIMVKNLGLTIHLTWLIMVYLTLKPLL
jgi:hypothetical protein